MVIYKGDLNIPHVTDIYYLVESLFKLYINIGFSFNFFFIITLVFLNQVPHDCF